MPNIKRAGKPHLHYELDDYTDPWRKSEVILLQHGFARTSEIWYRWVPYLSRFYKVVRPDLRGFGKSSRDFDLESGISVDAYIEDLEAIMTDVGVESVHYCGESLGGIIGMLLAAQRPQRVRTLSLMSSPVRINEGFKKQMSFGHATWEDALRTIGARGYADARNAADRFPPNTDPGLMRWFAEVQGSADLETMIAVQKRVLGLDATPYLSKIEAPVLGMYPESGSITTPEQQEALRANVRNLKLITVATRYHNLFTTQPAMCAQAVLHFAAQHDGIPCREA
jgi:3-oxoadipate enol-lactonase